MSTRIHDRAAKQGIISWKKNKLKWLRQRLICLVNGHNKQFVRKVTYSDGFSFQIACTCGHEFKPKHKHSFHETGNLRFHYDEFTGNTISYSIGRREFFV